MRKRCCHSSGVNGMASTSALVSRALLLTVALLLLECMVRCEIVGTSNHVMEGGKIKTLNPGQYDCDIVQDEKGIKIKYNKGSETALKGCSIDFFTKNEGIIMEFGIENSGGGPLTGCLVEEGSAGENYAGDANLLPFTFSLPEGKFNALKSEGIQLGAKTDCDRACKATCLLSAEYAAAFVRKGDNVIYTVQILGEPYIWKCTSGTDKHSADSSSFTIKFSKIGNGWATDKSGCSQLDYDKGKHKCHKPGVLRKAMEWEIPDNPPVQSHKYLFNLNILPLSTVPRHIPSEAVDLKNKLSGAKNPACNMFIKLNAEYFKVHGKIPPPPPGSTPPGGSSGVPDTGSTTSTDPPADGSTEAASGGNMLFIIGGIVGVVVLLAVVGGLVWFFVLRGKGEEEEGMEMGMTGAGATKTKTKAGGTTVGATQAKTGGMTTVGGTQAKTGGATTAGGAASKAAGTTKGGATSKAGGATSKK
ncbi:hypothetical protein ACQ4LE_010558 [Meloidogyne hapla]|uniref:Uncharacterized protein n=1 Tax=Meloidogyne hapla TaxID=6305 RepID=A0A1I8BBZ8_MELHA